MTLPLSPATASIKFECHTSIRVCGLRGAALIGLVVVVAGRAGPGGAALHGRRDRTARLADFEQKRK